MQIPIEELDAWLKALLDRMENASFAEPLTECHSELLRGNAANFERQEDSRGVPWPARKDNKPHPLLRLNLDMYNAAAVRGSPGQVEQVEARASRLGINLDSIEYARAQNFGHHYVPTWGQTLPAREYYYATDATLERCDEILAEAGVELLF